MIATLFSCLRGGLMAIDPEKGETIAQFPWRARKLESVNAATPVVVGNEVFISETYELGSALSAIQRGLIHRSVVGSQSSP